MYLFLSPLFYSSSSIFYSSLLLHYRLCLFSFLSLSNLVRIYRLSFSDILIAPFASSNECIVNYKFCAIRFVRLVCFVHPSYCEQLAHPRATHRSRQIARLYARSMFSSHDIVDASPSASFSRSPFHQLIAC